MAETNLKTRQFSISRGTLKVERQQKIKDAELADLVAELAILTTMMILVTMLRTDLTLITQMVLMMTIYKKMNFIVMTITIYAWMDTMIQKVSLLWMWVIEMSLADAIKLDICSISRVTASRTLQRRTVYVNALICYHNLMSFTPMISLELRL